MISVVSPTVCLVRRFIDEPSRRLFAGKAPLKRKSRTSERLVDAARKLSQPGLEHRSLRLGVGRKTVQAPAQLLLCLRQAPLELCDRLRALAFESLSHLDEPLLES